MEADRQKKIEYIRMVSSIYANKYFKLYNVDPSNFSKGYIKEEQADKVLRHMYKDLQNIFNEARNELPGLFDGDIESVPVTGTLSGESEGNCDER